MILKRKKGVKTAIILMLAIFAASLYGCGNAGSGRNDAEKNGGGENGELSLEAMGRYVEEPVDLSGKISGDGSGIYPLANGNLIVTDRYTEFVKTGDLNVWMTDRRRWRTNMLEEGVYIMSMAVGPDNTVGLIYQAADDTEIPVDIALTEDDQYPDQVYIADSGRIFVTTRGNSNLYEVREDGSGELFLTVEAGHPDLIQFQGNLMVMDGYEYDSLAIYDLDREEYIEDAVLEEFIRTNYGDRENRSIDSHALYFFFGEEEILYLAEKRDCIVM